MKKNYFYTNLPQHRPMISIGGALDGPGPNGASEKINPVSKQSAVSFGLKLK
jgi:hypothetical protein